MKNKKQIIKILLLFLTLAISIIIYLSTLYKGFHFYNENLITIRLIIAYISSIVGVISTGSLIILFEEK